MNRKILLLNLLLLGAIGALGWTLRKQWLEADAHTRAIMNRRIVPPAVMPPPAPAAIAAVAPADYIEVAQKTLFSSDRNPNVAIEAPKPPPPPPPMPALPVYFGQMHFGEPVVVLTVGKSPEQKSYSVGQMVGDFKLVAFNRETITFDWDGKQVERKLDELAPKKDAQQQQQPNGPAYAPTPAPAPAPPPQGGSVKSISGAGSSSGTDVKDPLSGPDMGAGLKGCVMGDTTKPGTVLNGWKKVVGGGILGMGESCHWEQK